MDELDLELYDILSDKTYSEGCLIKIIDRMNTEKAIYGMYLVCYAKVDSNETFFFNNDEFSKIEAELGYDDDYFFEIIGHEPTLQDMMKQAREFCWNWIANSNNWLSFSEGDCQMGGGIEYDFTKSLLKQTDSVKRAIIQHFYQPNEE